MKVKMDKYLNAYWCLCRTMWRCREM